MYYPHMFRVVDEEHKKTVKYVVILAHSDFSYENPWWLSEPTDQDPDLVKNNTLRPTIDVEHHREVFDGPDAEKAAWEFIREWWTNPSLGIT